MNGQLFTCLINVDGINFKVIVKPRNKDTIGIDDLKNVIPFRSDELADYDIFNDTKYILEIFDPNFDEYVTIDKRTVIHDKAKLRAKRRKILESNGFLNGYFQPIPINTTVKDMLKINDYEEKRNLVAAIEKVSSTEQVTYKVRSTDDSIKALHKGRFWTLIAEEMSVITNKPYDPKLCMSYFYGLLGQYQILLMEYKNYTPEQIQHIWPLFKMFHYGINCRIFVPTIATLVERFNKAEKTGGVHSRLGKRKRDDCNMEFLQLEKDFSLVTAVAGRMKQFKERKKRDDVWKNVSIDLSYYQVTGRSSALYWQKRFHLLLRKYLEITSQKDIPQNIADTWPLFTVISQLDLSPFLSPKASEDDDVFHSETSVFDRISLVNELYPKKCKIKSNSCIDIDSDDNDVIILDSSPHSKVDPTVQKLVEDMIDQIVSMTNELTS